jgi:hypothetical protein
MMKRIIWVAMLLVSPGMMLVAQGVDAPSTSGLWKIDGDVQGTPVKMTCTLTEADHKLSGSCSGAADAYAPHAVTGKVKGQIVEWNFETAMQGNPISVTMSGTLNLGGSKINGDIDVEPMAVGGTFMAVRQSPDAAAAAAPAVATAAGDTWKVDGEIQGTPVPMTCVITEADHKLSGTCSGAGDQTPRKITGDATGPVVTWKFDSEYQGSPITISFSGTKNADGTKMSGSMSVAPMGVDGTFVAVKK